MTHMSDIVLIMDVSRPYSAIGPFLDVDVLVTLEGTTRPLTGREVAELAARGSQKGVLRTLERLVQQGLVHRQEAGRALLYTLNRDHLAAPAVEWLAGMRRELLQRLREALTAWTLPPAHASLFGSLVRGEGDTQSDIDLFLVRPEGVTEDAAGWRGQVEGLADDVLRWTGNRLGVSELPAEDLDGLVRRDPPIVAALRRESVTLAGPEITEILGHGS